MDHIKFIRFINELIVPILSGIGDLNEDKAMLHRATLDLKWTSERPWRVDVLLTRAWAQLRHWRAIYRQRRALLGLSDHLLKDIGISRVDALQEGNKPFWRS